mmetsp:Transcript_73751/g.240188  ORF Transcript_73751/g.240188 Transcript_73751/m.240188 type:complete len:831 (-) Transcript_73751:101-2593(-)|eukprot:CAMPEP_0203869380 /NCGR_PEP_ID=MMETSP0359-20131031/17662_1 /ASSEMBLY_ACC=CAM_ASM_000338 /TAXON_ID=268821 /ORGANISM="Scrippsiella Hangoei, Strain SHTV-5" /LENGTH=830 /DNA_ID=CAMNT_0050787975 /DNA_START=111 /DNA_END=2603 /DNA_ORIENTATION=+
MASKAVVVGIDLGACESYVAYVGKGIVDMVQNEVSKRATPTIVGFTDRERLLGDAALSQIRSNAKNTCRNFKHLLGRKVGASDLEIENFWTLANIVECEDGHAGFDVTYKGQQRNMSAVECTAMILHKLKEVTEKWCEGKVTDVVISVPSIFSDVQRQAVLDAAKISGLSVLRLMNEHTATALAYGIYRSNDFDPEKPMTVAFCSMGTTLFSVSIVQFIRGKLTVVCERSDKVGGRELDECLMRSFAADFKKKVGCDPLSTKKSLFKLEDAVQKTKKVLSANIEAPVNVECLMEEEDFAGSMNRDDLERMCAPAIERVIKVLEDAKTAAQAAGVDPDSVDTVEIVGGGSRVPWVKRVCGEAFNGKTLSTTMNQEESVARGCALQAAILSPLYKVRDFKVEDATQFSVLVGWMGSAADAAAAAEEDGDTRMEGAEGEYKTATVFPAGSQTNCLKMLTFYRKGPFEVKAEFSPDSALLPLTPRELGTYKIELPPSAEAKKVKVRAKLTINGTFQIEGAQLIEEEEYEEITKEKREIPAAETEAPAAEAPAEGEEKKEGEGEKKEEKKEEKKYEWVDVKKMKKRTKRTDLKVTASGVPGLSGEYMQRLMDAESAMQTEMRDIVETDERRNDLESFIFNMRDKVAEGNEYGDFISSADREAFQSELTKAEDWLFDTVDATKMQFIEKLDELKRTGDAVIWRFKESGMRAEWIQAVQGTVTNYRDAAANPADKYDHIAPEKLTSIVNACNELETWLKETAAKQETVPKHEKPVLICADMEKKNQELAKMADDILKEAKPAPPKEEKKEEAPKEAPKEEEKAEEEPEKDGDVLDVD